MSKGIPGDSGASGTDDDWFVCCSDEEKYTSTGCAKGKLEWNPPEQEMMFLLEKIEAAKSAQDDPLKPVFPFTLDWKCPGRRPPTPSDASEEEDDDYDDDDDEAAAAAAQAQAQAAGFEFDTADEIVPSGTPLAKLSTSKELRGSARKKTSDLSSILNNMKRHRKIDEMATNSPAANPTPSTSAPTPTTQ